MRANLNKLRETCGRLVAMHGHRLPNALYVDVMAGRPRITTRDGGRNISPRLSVGEMTLWLSAFEAALIEVETREIETARAILKTKP